MYLVLETDTAKPVTDLCKRVCDKPHGPFTTPAAARNFVKKDAAKYLTFHEKMEVGEPDNEAGSVHMIVKVVQVLHLVPTPKVTWKMEEL